MIRRECRTSFSANYENHLRIFCIWSSVFRHPHTDSLISHFSSQVESSSVEDNGSFDYIPNQSFLFRQENPVLISLLMMSLILPFSPRQQHLDWSTCWITLSSFVAANVILLSKDEFNGRQTSSVPSFQRETKRVIQFNGLFVVIPSAHWRVEESAVKKRLVFSVNCIKQGHAWEKVETLGFQDEKNIFLREEREFVVRCDRRLFLLLFNSIRLTRSSGENNSDEVCEGKPLLIDDGLLRG